MASCTQHNKILTLCLCTLCFSIPVRTVLATNWPCFHADNANTGTTPDSGPESDNVRWQFVDRDRGQFDAPPAVVDGRVYAADDYGYVYCFDADDGTIIWQGQVNAWFEESGLCVDSGKLFIGSRGGDLYCFDADGDGGGGASLLWTYNGREDYATSALVDNGYVYYATDEWLYCLDLSGNLQWEFWSDTGDNIRNGPAVYNNKLYISSERTEIFCVDLADPLQGDRAGNNNGIIEADRGEHEWDYTNYGGNSSPAIYDDGQGHVYAYVARATGAHGEAGVSQIDLATHTEDANYAANGLVWSTPAVYAGHLWFGDDSGKFYHYTYQLEWTYDTGEQIFCSAPVTTGNNHDLVYFTANDNDMHCLRAQDKDADGNPVVVWVDSQHSFTDESPAAYNGSLYVGGNWHDLIAYGPATGNKATVNAYCPTDHNDISVDIALNGLPTAFSTPHAFIGDVNEFTPIIPVDISVPHVSAGYQFDQWETGEKTNTLTVTNGGVYTALYKPINTMDGNRDGQITMTDVAMLAAKWLQTPGPQCWQYPAVCHGDVNGDGFVSVVDQRIVEQSIGGTYPDIMYNPCADVDQNGTVDQDDLDVITITNWGIHPPGDCTAAPWPPIP